MGGVWVGVCERCVGGEWSQMRHCVGGVCVGGEWGCVGGA